MYIYTVYPYQKALNCTMFCLIAFFSSWFKASEISCGVIKTGVTMQAKGFLPLLPWLFTLWPRGRLSPPLIFSRINGERHGFVCS